MENAQFRPPGADPAGELPSAAADKLLLKTSRRRILVGERTLVMGIINVTPDSFSDGGRFHAPERAVEEGLRMVEEGADLLDIGGESTRPGSEPVPADVERQRVIPVIRGLAGRVAVPLSIDTMKATVAREALAEGAEIVNDVSAMTFDPRMAKAVADTGAAIVLMHMRGMPKAMQQGDLTYRSLPGDIIDYLRGRIDQAADQGIDREQIIVDPGIGFGKTMGDNMRLIRHLRDFSVLGRPILVGPSRKAFIGQVTGGTPAERLPGTAAAVTAVIMNGGHLVRVHDVSVIKRVAAMADAIGRA